MYPGAQTAHPLSPSLKYIDVSVSHRSPGFPKLGWGFADDWYVTKTPVADRPDEDRYRRLEGQRSGSFTFPEFSQKVWIGEVDSEMMLRSAISITPTVRHYSLNLFNRQTLTDGHMELRMPVIHKTI